MNPDAPANPRADSRARRDAFGVGAAVRALRSATCDPSRARTAFVAALDRVESAAAAAPRMELATAWGALLDAWLKDDDAVLQGAPEAKLYAAIARLPNGVFLAVLAARRNALLLPFPAPDDGRLDARRLTIVARRARLDRLFGEGLAAAGRPEFAVLTGLERWAKEGDAVDAVFALHRAGRPAEALALARDALAAPTSVRTDVLRVLRDRLFPRRGARRAAVRATEADFISRPTIEGFAALRDSHLAVQWPACAARVLGALQRTQREPSLVFTLYLDEGLVQDADGLATTQAVSAEALRAGAERVLPTHPTLAAGWLFTAAHRLADADDAARRDDAAALLVRVRALAAETGRAEDFRRALARLRSRHADRPGVLRALARRGL